MANYIDITWFGPMTGKINYFLSWINNIYRLSGSVKSIDCV